MDIALDARGTIYLMLASGGPIVIIDSVGAPLRRIGEIGTVLDALLSPVSVTLVGDTLAVLDSRLDQIKMFHIGGRFIRAFPAPSGARQLLRGPEESLLVTVATDTVVAYRFDLKGRKVGAYLRSPRAGRNSSLGFLPDPGGLCSNGDELVYANPWIYELAALNAKTGDFIWTARYESEVIRPYTDSTGEIRPQAIILGLECLEDYIVLAYIDLRTSRVFYDVLDRTGVPLARMGFMRDSSDMPGFLAGSLDNTIATFKSRPHQIISLYSIAPN